ncbi:glycoside hydrolase family 47 protein [Viridothelium virens]|uniref:alpha-1,2-Mannosidase n=1 Tax=Viridothelium virens TaxID=1048519 RepID=A0A6A6GW05_VIRVR|nr:glycoside hydrolase family 47 protein [Viridothelium virens]
MNYVAPTCKPTKESESPLHCSCLQLCWQAYSEKAWLKDEFTPVSNGWKNNFGGYAATLVDNLDTLFIMDFEKEFEEAVAAAVEIDFDPAISALEEINIFETTIRHLGGFLGAYELTECKDKRLLDKAIEIGDMIYKSFDTPNRMPITHWNPRKAAEGELQSAPDDGLLAELASSSMELTRLSQLTGDMRWFDATQRITDMLDEQQNQTTLPGMWPAKVNARESDVRVGRRYSIGGETDSTYEYLVKMIALLGEGDVMEQYKRMYEFSMDTAFQHILFRPLVPDNADILIPGSVIANVHGESSLNSKAEHLACVFGGMLALGGRLFQNDTYLENGHKVTQGCVWAYRNSPMGIMADSVQMIACDSDVDCEWHNEQPEWYQLTSDPSYRLRPEAIESVFYLYRITGDEMYQDIAWEMFQAVNKATRTVYANAMISNVMSSHVSHQDSMESFWMSETLKYFYLIFSEPEFLSLDTFVFNTEAHPFRRNR